MSFNIGGSANKSKGSSTTNSTSTSTPNVPDWISDSLQGLNSTILDYGNVDPATLVAPASALQNQAAQAAGGLTGSPWNFDAAADVTRGVINGKTPQITASSLLTGLNSHMSPYLKDVVDVALTDYDVGADRTRGQQTLDMAGQGAFGGSGSALARSMTEGELTRGRASTSANLRDQGFKVGADLADRDANRQQGAAALNAQLMASGQDRDLAGARQLVDLSTAFDANQRDNLDAQAGLGGDMRAIDQAQRTAPMDLTAWQIAQITGLPMELFVGRTETGTSNTNSKGTSLGFSASGGR